ncbi:hypothetical protein GQ42DRAFT_23545 [Ramicandelaber brevisporus]|nr:hypothetical protein GQ42DRAFT_23545 [Ramicandelaber brevisporus]
MSSFRLHNLPEDLARYTLSMLSRDEAARLLCTSRSFFAVLAPHAWSVLPLNAVLEGYSTLRESLDRLRIYGRFVRTIDLADEHRRFDGANEPWLSFVDGTTQLKASISSYIWPCLDGANGGMLPRLSHFTLSVDVEPTNATINSLVDAIEQHPCLSRLTVIVGGLHLEISDTLPLLSSLVRCWMHSPYRVKSRNLAVQGRQDIARIPPDMHAVLPLVTHLACSHNLSFCIAPFLRLFDLLGPSHPPFKSMEYLAISLCCRAVLVHLRPHLFPKMKSMLLLTPKQSPPLLALPGTGHFSSPLESDNVIGSQVWSNVTNLSLEFHDSSIIPNLEVFIGNTYPHLTLLTVTASTGLAVDLGNLGSRCRFIKTMSLSGQVLLTLTPESFTRLRSLALERCDIGSITHLQFILGLPTLTELRLQNVAIPDLVLIGHSGSNVRHLVLIYAGVVDCVPFVSLIRSLPHLRQLAISPSLHNQLNPHLTKLAIRIITLH